MITIALVNQKGGVAKTSTVFHLSAEFASRGLRVLACDLDPQGSLTQGFLGPVATAALDPWQTASALFHGPDREPAPEAVVRPSGVPGVDLVPGAVDPDAEHNTPERASWAGREWGVRSLLDALAGDHDIALLDCPPNLHLCTWAALLASGPVLVPLQPEDFGSQGLAPVHGSLRAASARNPGLYLAGYLLTMVDRRLGVHGAYEAALRETYGPAVLAATIPRASAFVEAVTARRPVRLHKPRSAASRAVASLASEVLARVEAAGQGREGVAA